TDAHTLPLEAGEPYCARILSNLRSLPEVVPVTSQHRRPDHATAPTVFFNAEFFAPLTPFHTWPRGLTKEKLIAQMQSRLEQELAGIDFNFSQNIQDNVEEALSGVKGENSVKVFGSELEVLEQKGGAIKQQLASVRGVQDLAVFSELAQPNLLIDVLRYRA